MKIAHNDRKWRERERERETENMQIMSGNRFELMPSQDLEQVSVADTEANPTSPYGSWDQLPAGGSGSDSN